MSDHVRYERHGSTALITIDRPDVMNAIGPQTHRELKAAWQRFLDEDDAHVAVLTGAGEKAFSAGGDLQAAREGNVTFDDPDGVLGPSRWTSKVNKPTIAAINGLAYAGGLEWACWTHLAVADEHATFGVTCRRWNIGLADGGTQRLPRIVGWRRAMELIVTGRVIDAAEALRIGLVNEVVPSGTCVERALQWAETIGALPQPAIRTDLEAAERGWGLDDGLQIEAAAFMRSISRPEAQEGLRQFTERDHPDRR